MNAAEGCFRCPTTKAKGLKVFRMESYQSWRLLLWSRCTGPALAAEPSLLCARCHQALASQGRFIFFLKISCACRLRACGCARVWDARCPDRPCQFSGPVIGNSAEQLNFCSAGCSLSWEDLPAAGKQSWGSNGR